MTRLVGRFERTEWERWGIPVLTILGLAAFVALALLYARTTPSNVDEGSYLYKGYAFAMGWYQPFQDYGFWMGKPPLAFLIPGYAQRFFGIGLLSGRYFSIVLATLALIGAWVAARRMGERWLAVALIWMVVLSPGIVQVNSLAISQPQTSFFLAWTLAFALGANRSFWELLISVLLATLTLLTRQNMAPVLPILLAYIWWQYGWKPTLKLFLVAAAVILFVHVLYWPNIMLLWTPWMPKPLVQWLNLFPASFGKSAAVSSVDFSNRIIAVFRGITGHFIPVLGAIASIIFWPRRESWEEKAKYAGTVFIAVLFVVLFVLHIGVIFQEGYLCVYCVSPYLTFFDLAGLLLFVVTVRRWQMRPSALLQVLAVLLVLLFATGQVLGMFESIGNSLLAIHVPRFTPSGISWNSRQIVDILDARFSHNTSRKLISALLGFSIGTLLVLLTALGYWLARRKRALTWSFGSLALVVFLVAGYSFPPLTSGFKNFAADCPDLNVPAAYQQVGESLSQAIPAGSQVYWAGGPSFIPLLYVPQAGIFPPQINPAGYRIGGDTDNLARYGFWNQEMEQQWYQQADFLIVSETLMGRLKKNHTEAELAQFEEVPIPLVQLSCTVKTYRIHLYQRIK